MKKLTREYEGRSYFLTEGEHRKLLKRFNPSEFVLSGGLWWRNKVPCALCEKYNPPTLITSPCRRCTFNKATSIAGEVGCINIVRALLNGFWHASLEKNQVSFHHENRINAIATIKKIRRFIKGFK